MVENPILKCEWEARFALNRRRLRPTGIAGPVGVSQNKVGPATQE
jgi:hypothetical protein